jgi:hypothetical protein
MTIAVRLIHRLPRITDLYQPPLPAHQDECENCGAAVFTDGKKLPSADLILCVYCAEIKIG